MEKTEKRRADRPGEAGSGRRLCGKDDVQRDDRRNDLESCGLDRERVGDEAGRVGRRGSPR
jgi:hypothetical protein